MPSSPLPATPGQTIPFHFLCLLALITNVARRYEDTEELQSLMNCRCTVSQILRIVTHLRVDLKSTQLLK